MGGRVDVQPEASLTCISWSMQLEERGGGRREAGGRELVGGPEGILQVSIPSQLQAVQSCTGMSGHCTQWEHGLPSDHQHALCVGIQY